MIPAVLTCLFVVWLYRSLNGAAEHADLTAHAAPAVTPDIDALTARLAALEARVKRLGESHPPGGART
ncbi:MAG: hypothetical protein KDA44_02690 [Planctomycetales bacterium]|nr:hypothetical protein [Planctomycetales bacterium]